MSGQLGSEIIALEANYPQHHFFFTDISELDITNKEAIQLYVTKNNINTIINCAAYTAVDKAESEPELANKINHLAVQYLAEAAKLLGENFNFLIIGDGGLKHLLELKINELNIKNVTLMNPVSRKKLIQIYESTDHLFLHLNDYPAYKKVLPSKIFELSTYPTNILAGVGGFASNFIKKEISNSFVFEPCDINALVNFLLSYENQEILKRKKFINKFKRSIINKKLANSILNYLK